MKPAFTKVEDIIRNLKTHGIEDPGEGITLSPLIVLLLFLRSFFSFFFFCPPGHVLKTAEYILILQIEQ